MEDTSDPPYELLHMYAMEPHLRGTEFNGGMRGGGSLKIVKDGAVVGVLPANMLTSTAHKTQRRAHFGAPLLDLLLQSMIYGVLKRILVNAKETSAKAALTQVINRFVISFLEEGVLITCTVTTAHSLMCNLRDLVDHLDQMKQAADNVHTIEDKYKKQEQYNFAIKYAMEARKVAHKCVALCVNTPRARLISILGADAAPEDRPADVEALPDPLSHIHDWKVEITENAYKNKATLNTFRMAIQKMMNEWPPHCANSLLEKKIARMLWFMPIKHPEYASMVWRYAFLLKHSDAGFRSHAEAFLEDTPPYYEEDAGLPGPYQTMEEVIDAFGIKDVHTGQGTLVEFVTKGSVVCQEPSDMIVFGHSIAWWRERYVKLRTQVMPDKFKRKRGSDHSHQSKSTNDANDDESVAGTRSASSTTSSSASSNSNKVPRIAGNMQSPMALFAQRFADKYVAQLPTGKHKARVVLESDAETNQLTGIATKIFYSQASYVKTRRQYEKFKAILPDMVSEWEFDDAGLTITFPRLPGTSPITPIEGENFTLRDSFFETKLKVVDVSNFGYNVLKVKSHVDPRVVASPRLLVDLITSVVVQRAIGITDVGPRQFLCFDDPNRVQDCNDAFDPSDPSPLTRLLAIDMSDGSTYDDATRDALFRGNTLTEALLGGMASGKLAKDCVLRKAIDEFGHHASHKHTWKEHLRQVLFRATEKNLLQIDSATILERLSAHF